MRKEDDEFLQRLRATFKVEAEEHVRAMSSGLLALEKLPAAEGKTELLEEVFRRAHSLKGAARAANAADAESICQSMEDVFAAWKRREISLAPENFDALHRAIDLIGTLVQFIDGPRAPGEGAIISAVIRQLGQLTSAEATGAARPGPSALPPAPAAVEQSGGTARSLPVPKEISPRAETLPPIPVRPALAETIRISTAKLDGLLLQAEEMLTVKQTAIQRLADLRQFEALFEEWTRQWGRIQPQLRAWRSAATPGPNPAGIPPASELLDFLDWNLGYVRSLEGKVRALGKSAAQDRHAIGKQVDDLLADSKKLLMLPFATLSDLIPKLVRDLSRDQGKDVDLVIHGSDVEMDKRILEEMKDPLIHLVRNCIDHGVEPAKSGLRRDKPPRATITISAAQANGNRVEIVVSDDGVGLDLARVKESAVRRGVISEEEVRLLDERKAMDLIFLSEVSTSPIITEISGRGLGLAIVREKTEKLGGRVFVESRMNVGTTFRIGLPLTLATFRGILVRAAEQLFVIPTSQVERVGRVRTAEIKTIENRETISWDGRVVAFVRLEEVLEMPPGDRSGAARDHQAVVALGSGDERIAFGVDEVLHDEEVLVKSLVRPLARVRNIAGATVLASGRIAPILNAADLMKSARKSAGRSRVAPAMESVTPGISKPRTVLLAEDSVTSRMLLKGILESAGYQVTTAVDGVDALMALRTEDFDLVVSDVEMPRLNGFDLTAQIRSDNRMADKPVVLVTALSSAADRERGIDVGANAYIVKSSFDQSNLLDVIRRLAG
ncbi:MAG TPA: response regulator [Candidatus Didemnitutus sp.]